MLTKKNLENCIRINTTVISRSSTEFYYFIVTILCPSIAALFTRFYHLCFVLTSSSKEELFAHLPWESNRLLRDARITIENQQLFGR